VSSCLPPRESVTVSGVCPSIWSAGAHYWAAFRAARHGKERRCASVGVEAVVSNEHTQQPQVCDVPGGVQRQHHEQVAWREPAQCKPRSVCFVPCSLLSFPVALLYICCLASSPVPRGGHVAAMNVSRRS
jgi:hypothetical protein